MNLSLWWYVRQWKDDTDQKWITQLSTEALGLYLFFFFFFWEVLFPPIIYLSVDWLSPMHFSFLYDQVRCKRFSAGLVLLRHQNSPAIYRICLQITTGWWMDQEEEQLNFDLNTLTWRAAHLTRISIFKQQFLVIKALFFQALDSWWPQNRSQRPHLSKLATPHHTKGREGIFQVRTAGIRAAPLHNVVLTSTYWTSPAAGPGFVICSLPVAKPGLKFTAEFRVWLWHAGIYLPICRSFFPQQFCFWYLLLNQ